MNTVAMINRARSFGLFARRSARACSLTMICTECSLWLTSETIGTNAKILPTLPVDGAMKIDRYLTNRWTWICNEQVAYGISREIATSTDSIHHRRAENVRGVHIAVDIRFQCRVHRDESDPADDFGIVRDLHRPKDEFRFQLCQFVEESCLSFRRESQGGRRSETKFVTVEQVEDRILNHLRVHFNRTKSIIPRWNNRLLTTLSPRHLTGTDENGVGNISDSGLKRQQRLRDSCVESIDESRVEWHTHFRIRLREG